MKRRDFIKRGALFVPTIFIPRLIRAQSILTAPGLASFGTNAATGGGGGGDDLTGLSLRYKADDITGSDGDQILTWPDSGGGGHDLTQPSGSLAPILKVGFVNGHRAAQFDGTQQYVSGSVAPTLIGTAQATAIFIVMKQNGATANNGALHFSNSDVIDIFATFSDVLYFDWHDNVEHPSGGRVHASQPTGWDDAWHVVEVHRNGANQSILVDGTTLISATDAAGSLDQTGTGSLFLGQVGGIYLGGYIAEVRIYNSNKDGTNIRAALKSTYGTP